MRSKIIICLLLFLVVVITWWYSSVLNSVEKLEIQEGDTLLSVDEYHWNANVNDTQTNIVDTLFVSLDDKFEIAPSSDLDISICLITPVADVYDNYNETDVDDMSTYTVPIAYRIELLDEKAVLNDEFFRGVGTYYVGLGKDTYYDESSLYFESKHPIHKEFMDVIQIVVRENDSYIGYIQELTRTPFVYVPKNVEGYHQTDERVGSDCAEFAIYGMRRLGFNIPYVGPRGIYDYCNPIGNGYVYVDKFSEEGLYKDENLNHIEIGLDGLQEGDVLHFGEQVSVFYRDLGVEGVLDHNDLLIQSYIRGIEIIPIKESEFVDYPLKLIRFKSGLSTE